MEKTISQKTTSHQYLVPGPAVTVTAEPRGFEQQPPPTFNYAFKAGGRTVRVQIEKRDAGPPIVYSISPAGKLLSGGPANVAVDTTTTTDAI